MSESAQTEMKKINGRMEEITRDPDYLRSSSTGKRKLLQAEFMDLVKRKHEIQQAGGR